MPGRYWTAINVGPDLFSDIIFSKTVQKLNKNGLIERVVFELTERAPFTAARLLPVVEKLKKIGLTLSLDDMGCGFIDMETVRILRPAIVKLCITITDTIRINEETEKMIKGLLKRVRGYGGVLLAEGVKRAEQIEMLKSCGVPLAQGSYYAQPRPANKIL